MFISTILPSTSSQTYLYTKIKKTYLWIFTLPTNYTIHMSIVKFFDIRFHRRGTMWGWLLHTLKTYTGHKRSWVVPVGKISVCKVIHTSWLTNPKVNVKGSPSITTRRINGSYTEDITLLTSLEGEWKIRSRHKRITQEPKEIYKNQAWNSRYTSRL